MPHVLIACGFFVFVRLENGAMKFASLQHVCCIRLSMMDKLLSKSVVAGALH